MSRPNPPPPPTKSMDEMLSAVRQLTSRVADLEAEVKDLKNGMAGKALGSSHVEGSELVGRSVSAMQGGSGTVKERVLPYFDEELKRLCAALPVFTGVDREYRQWYEEHSYFWQDCQVKCPTTLPSIKG